MKKQIGYLIMGINKKNKEVIRLVCEEENKTIDFVLNDIRDIARAIKGEKIIGIIKKYDEIPKKER